MAILDENKETVRRYYKEVVEAGHTELLTELIAEDVVNHNPLSDESLTAEEARGFEGFRRHVEVFQEAFPDRTFSIEDLIAEGDSVSARLRFEGTHEGRFAGIEPTGNRISGSSMAFYRIEDGKIVERWYETDNLELFKQLDAIERHAQ
ncbi:ester cyclase [Haloprofundus halobius]|uniref:ester cyclase n=1 Tax=Haloprofundus halobius TaxID=2876194 RepID=UPI001CCB8C29|nr:ester cyclase [Haloprofundus halobius]